MSTTPPFPPDFPDDWGAQGERPVESAFGGSEAPPFRPPPPAPQPSAPFSSPGPVPSYGQPPAYGQPSPYGQSPPVPSGPAPPPYGQPVPYGYQQYGMAAAGPTQTNGFAVTSLVLGIVGIVLFCLWAIPSILAVVFAGVSLNQIKTQPNRYFGRGMAIAGMVTGLVGIGLFVLLLAAGDGGFWLS